MLRLNGFYVGPEPDRRQRFAVGDVGRSVDPQELVRENVIGAKAGRPDSPDETSDGLDNMEEVVRHQAEDLPLDTQGGNDGAKVGS